VAIGYRLTPRRDIITFPGWHSPLDPSEHPKDRVHEAVKKGDRMLLDCTKPLIGPERTIGLGSGSRRWRTGPGDLEQGPGQLVKYGIKA